MPDITIATRVADIAATIEAIPPARRNDIISVTARSGAAEIHMHSGPLPAPVAWSAFACRADPDSEYVAQWSHRGVVLVFGLATAAEAVSWGCPAEILAPCTPAPAPSGATGSAAVAGGVRRRPGGVEQGHLDPLPRRAP